METSSDDSCDSGTRQKSTKPVTSSNKSSTFPDKHKSDNEETPLKQPHQDAITSKQESLERIKRLHIKCCFLDTEHLFMLTINWVEHQELPDVNVEIEKIFYNAYCTEKKMVEKYFDSWDPKIHGPRKYLQSFYVAALIDECSTNKHYPLENFRNNISKKTRSSYKGMMDNGTPSSSSDYEMALK